MLWLTFLVEQWTSDNRLIETRILLRRNRFVYFSIRNLHTFFFFSSSDKVFDFLLVLIIFAVLLFFSSAAFLSSCLKCSWLAIEYWIVFFLSTNYFGAENKFVSKQCYHSANEKNIYFVINVNNSVKTNHFKFIIKTAIPKKRRKKITFFKVCNSMGIIRFIYSFAHFFCWIKTFANTRVE